MFRGIKPLNSFILYFIYLYNYNGRLIELVYTLLIFYTRLNSGEGVKTNEKDKNRETDERI